jgi:FkbM family methyltransferase
MVMKDPILSFESQLISPQFHRLEWEERYSSLANSTELLQDVQKTLDKHESPRPISRQESYYRVALLFLRRGKEEHACRIFAENEVMTIGSWWWRLRYAEALWRRGDEDGAGSIILKTYESFREACNGFAEIGRVLTPSDSKTAVELFTKDEELNRLSSPARMHFACALERSGRAKDAVLQRYQHSRTEIDGFANLALKARSKHQYDDAMELFQLDHDLGRLSAPSRFKWAETALLRGDFARAIELVGQIYAEDPLISDCFSRLGFMKLKLGLHREAMDLLQKDANIGRISPKNRVALSSLLAQHDLFDAAERQVEWAYEADPELVDCFCRLGFMKLELGLHREAMDLLQKDAGIGRISPKNRIALSSLLAQHDLFDAAERQVEWAYEADSELVDCFCRLGFMKLELGLHREAMDLLQKDAGIGRISPKNRVALSSLLAQHDLFDAAERQVEWAYEADPGLIDCFCRLGFMKLELGLNREAMDFLQKDAGIDRISPKNRVALSSLLAQHDLFDAAERQVEWAYEADPELVDCFSRLGFMKLKLGLRREAMDLLQKDAGIDRISPKNRVHLSQMLAGFGYLDLAGEEIEKARTLLGNGMDLYASLIPHLPIDLSPKDWIQLFERDRVRCELSSDGEQNFLIAIAQAATLNSDFCKAKDQFHGIDIKEQWQTMDRSLRRCEAKQKTFPFLNAKLRIDSLRDALVQFQEIVLQEQYAFDCHSDRPFIVDGGANMGLAIAYFKHRFPDAEILAFEPHPQSYDCCMQNILFNGWKNVTLLPYALMDKEQKVPFHLLSDSPMGSGLTDRLLRQSNSDASRTVEVEAKTLAPFLNRKVDFLKLDIEGAEYEVLHTLQPLRGLVSAGFIEYHYDPMNDRNDLSGIVSILVENGFTYYITQPPAARFRSRSYDPNVPLHWSLNIFFKRRGECNDSRQPRSKEEPKSKEPDSCKN